MASDTSTAPGDVDKAIIWVADSEMHGGSLLLAVVAAVGFALRVALALGYMCSLVPPRSRRVVPTRQSYHPPFRPIQLFKGALLIQKKRFLEGTLLWI